jgi:hypothetical protein
VKIGCLWFCIICHLAPLLMSVCEGRGRHFVISLILSLVTLRGSTLSTPPQISNPLYRANHECSRSGLRVHVEVGPNRGLVRPKSSRTSTISGRIWGQPGARLQRFLSPLALRGTSGGRAPAHGAPPTATTLWPIRPENAAASTRSVHVAPWDRGAAHQLAQKGN